MRVLVSTTSGYGHIVPTLPLARALRDAGHHVVWASHEGARASIEGAGFAFRSAGMGIAERSRRLAEVAPELRDLPPRQRRPVVWAALFARLEAPARRDALLTIVETEHPDLIVREPCELASAAIAKHVDTPHMTVGFGGAIPGAALEAAQDSLAELWQSFGLEPRADAGLYEFLYLHPFPPSFGARPSASTVRDVSPSASSDDEVPPHWCADLGTDRPLVYVTFGTELGPMAPWRAILDGLKSLAIDAVCTIGREMSIGALGSVPPNVRVEQFVAQNALIKRSAVVVSHGGAGTVLGAAVAGVPQVLIPLAADQFDNADAVLNSGSGLVLESPELTSTRVAESIDRVLNDPGFAAAARAVASEIAVMPRPADRVKDVESLVSSYESNTRNET